MAFVLDASVSAVWALADESFPIADMAAESLKSEIALVPRLWWYEIRNLLVISERRLRITVADTAIFLELLSAYPIQIEQFEDEKLVLQLARQYQLSFYDAAYLALALDQKLPLATLDKPLALAAVAAGVPLMV
ncbi:MAG: type II toxin-antitoxin system VapC family toxin [Terracidiphilus sp.]|jgi:predicted nucleic acid-binding protein